MPLAHTRTNMQLPTDELPETLKLILSAVLGAGGVAWLRVWLENRRLGKKEFRETLLERVRELEKIISSLQVRMGNLRVEQAHLETENKQLRRELGLKERAKRTPDADDKPQEGEDDGEPA